MLRDSDYVLELLGDAVLAEAEAAQIQDGVSMKV